MVTPARALEASRWAGARWLVLAPHPDDETLGAGALIAETARAGRLGGIVYLTDGTGSHPDGTAGLAAARRREARIAVRRLTGDATTIDWIGWRDAHPPTADQPRFARDAAAFGALLRDRRIDAIAVTAANEAHCDHAAAFALATAAVRRSRRRVDLFAYHVWSDPQPDAVQILRTRTLCQGLRRHALRAHRSQLTGAYGPGFRLPADRASMPAADLLFLRKAKR